MEIITIHITVFSNFMLMKDKIGNNKILAKYINLMTYLPFLDDFFLFF